MEEFKQIIHGEPGQGRIFQNAQILMWFIYVI